jgi:hypothetical protein
MRVSDLSSNEAVAVFCPQWPMKVTLLRRHLLVLAMPTPIGGFIEEDSLTTPWVSCGLILRF